MRPATLGVALRLSDLPGLLADFQQLLNFLRRPHRCLTQVLNVNLALMIPHVQVAIGLVEQIIDTFVVDLQVAHADDDFPLNHRRWRA